MQGIPTPLKINTVMPDVQTGGLFGSLFAAITNMGKWLLQGLTAITSIAWDFIASQAPWFTDTLSFAYTYIGNSVNLITPISDLFQTFFSIITPQIAALTDGVQMIQDTIALIDTMTEPLQGNGGVWIMLLFMIFMVFPMMEFLIKGDFDAVKGEMQLWWGIINSILQWMFRLVTMVINFIANLVPF